jgi:hypothetical protein
MDDLGAHITLATTQDESLHPARSRSGFLSWLSRSQIYLAIVGILFSIAVFIWTQLSMLSAQTGWSWASFRVFGSGDQLSYLAEVVNGSRGNLAAVEPFTETGTNSDPHLYYQLLGAVSHVAGISPADVWNIAGVSLQVLLVACISLTSVVITRKWWTAYLGALPFLIGTLSFDASGWYTPMQAHAVLWGAFAVMFPLNSESASLAIAGTLFLLFLACAFRPTRSPSLMTIGIVTGAGIGLLANFHTYGFLTAIYIGIYVLASFAIASTRRWWLAVLSVLLIVVLFQVGPSFASQFGQLATLCLGLLPALPGILLAIVRWRVRVVGPLVAAAIAASPQVGGVWLALQSGNAFLKYREASSADLGVSWEQGLLCAAPVLIPLLLILVAGVHRKNSLWIAYASGTMTTWLLLAKNDVWGANQEPYRLWIDCFALTAFTIIPIVANVALDYLSLPKGGTERPHSYTRMAVASLVVIVVATGSISSVDWFRFYKSQEGQTMSFSTPVDQSIKDVALAVTGKELVLTEPCLDSGIVKAVTGVRLATYSYGLAWPTRKKEIDAVNLATAPLTRALLSSAGIGWIMTDGTCPTHWATEYSNLLRRTATSLYGPNFADVITLWRLRSPSLETG